MRRVKYLTSWKAGSCGWDDKLEASCKPQASCELGAASLGAASWKKARDHKLKVKGRRKLQAAGCKPRAVSRKLESQILDKLEILKIKSILKN